MASRTRRRFLAPEIIQTSTTDCGPAVLQSLLAGFHVATDYARLREACRTDVDGTSITAVDEIAVDLGLDVRQVLLPVDHLLRSNPASPTGDNLPAVLVVVQPSSETHFIVVWRRIGRFVQIMDPSTGRRWISENELLRRIYEYTHVFPADAWRTWAAGDEFRGPLQDRLQQLGAADTCEQVLEEAFEDPGWQSPATLDAAIRLAEDLVDAGGLKRGPAAGRVVAEVFKKGAELIPESFWTVQPGPTEDTVSVRGALLVHVRGVREEAGEDTSEDALQRLTPDAIHALKQPEEGPWKSLIRVFRERGAKAVPAVLGMVLASALVVILEALAFNTFLDLVGNSASTAHRLGALGLLLILVLFSTAGSFLGTEALLRFGRRLEVGLRLAFLRKLPRLHDRYLNSRLRSDLAERVHSLFDLRGLPLLIGEFASLGGALIFTVMALCWLDPRNAVAVIGLAALTIALPLAAQPLLAERDLRVRQQTGALSRYYLDALLGHFAARAHGAETTIRREHGRLLTRWVGSGLDLLRASTAIGTTQRFLTYGAAVAVVVQDIVRDGVGAGTLLFTYWVLKLPGLGDAWVNAFLRRPYYRSLATRLVEPLGARETEARETEARETGARETEAGAAQESEKPPGAVDLRWRDVHVRAGQITILQDVELHIGAGEHVAVMGPSGAGKSSLLGTLLGWNEPNSGEVLVDDQPLRGEDLVTLRRSIAWVDPAVQLWNRSLIENLRYGGADALPLVELLDACRLDNLVRGLPRGLDTALGEGGALVSGGEGQRVRLARALGREAPRLALLDEPFRGLDPETRHDLLNVAREHFRTCTLLCVTHDPAEAATFDRVVVLEGGRIVEVGAPDALAADPESHFSHLRAADADVRDALWNDPSWRRLRLHEGRLRELGA